MYIIWCDLMYYTLLRCNASICWYCRSCDPCSTFTGNLRWQIADVGQGSQTLEVPNCLAFKLLSLEKPRFWIISLGQSSTSGGFFPHHVSLQEGYSMKLAYLNRNKTQKQFHVTNQNRWTTPGHIIIWIRCNRYLTQPARNLYHLLQGIQDWKW